jgi:hypothetical protein
MAFWEITPHFPEVTSGARDGRLPRQHIGKPFSVCTDQFRGVILMTRRCRNVEVDHGVRRAERHEQGMVRTAGAVRSRHR